MHVFYSVYLSLLLLLLGCSSCQHQSLGVDTRYIDAQSLASRWVHTPDPKKYCPTTGQELIVWWRLPNEYLCCQDLQLRLTLRFCDREEETVSWPIRHFRGSQTYRIVDEKYWSHCGILTYKIEVIGEGCILDEWHHPIWADRIRFENYSDTCGRSCCE